jgi:hypothetical protein
MTTRRCTRTWRFFSELLGEVVGGLIDQSIATLRAGCDRSWNERTFCIFLIGSARRASSRPLAIAISMWAMHLHRTKEKPGRAEASPGDEPQLLEDDQLPQSLFNKLVFR